MLLGQAARPEVRPQMFERLRLADSAERVADHHLDELQYPERDTAVGLNPMGQILAKLGLEDGVTRAG